MEKETGYPHIDKPWMKYYDKEFLKQPMPQMGIYDYMKQKTEKIKDNVALSYYGKEISYAQLYENIDIASKILQELGVKNQDRIMFLMPNIPETAYLFYGSAQIGAVADYVDPRPDSIDLNISAKKILSLFQEEKAKYIVALEQCYLGMLKPIENELKELGLEEIIIVSANDSMNYKSRINYMMEISSFNGLKSLNLQLKRMKEMNEKMQQAKKKSSLRLLNYSRLIHECKNLCLQKSPYQSNQLNIIVHTSGTSSPKPKPIPLTNDNLNAYAHQTFGANMPMEIGDKALHLLPYFAAFGIVGVVHAGLCHGNNLIQIPEFSPTNLGKMLLKYKPQTLIGTPTWFLSLLNDPVLKNADLSFLKMVTAGGDTIEAEDEIKINQFLQEHKCSSVLTKGHGMSETCGCASYATGKYNQIRSIGIPLPQTIYALVNPETKKLVRFEKNQDTIEGELIISSKAVTPGKLDEKIIVPHAQYDGYDFIYTRDIGTMNKDGIFTFLSRLDRSFTRYDGFKIKPYEIENVIKQDKNVKYCIVSPYYAEDKFGNLALATIVLYNENFSSEEEKIQYVENLINNLFIKNPNVSSRQIPSKIRFVDSIPITNNGKVDYHCFQNQEFVGDEINIELIETNISVEKIKITTSKHLQKVKRI